MSKQNLTVSLDGEIVRQARVLAAERGTSISKLLAEKIAEGVAEAAAYKQARQRALTLLERGFHMGRPKKVARDGLHARR